MLVTNSTEKIGRNSNRIRNLKMFARHDNQLTRVYSLSINKIFNSHRKGNGLSKQKQFLKLGGFILLINKIPKISVTNLRNAKIQAMLAME